MTLCSNFHKSLLRSSFNYFSWNNKPILDDMINDHYLSNNLCNINTNIKKIEIYFYFKLSENNEYIFPVESDLLDINNQYGYDLIENIIKNINKKSFTITHNSKQYNVSLKDTDSILTLSTCASSGTKRMVLHATRMED